MQDLVEWISKLMNLQSLRLRSKDDAGRPADLSLKPFSGLNKLSHMNLLGRLQKLPEIDHFPPNIKVLTLSVSQLDEDPMPVLGQLQSLTVLRLFANSYLGEKIVCPRGTFKGLEVLKLWMLKDLKNLGFGRRCNEETQRAQHQMLFQAGKHSQQAIAAGNLQGFDLNQHV
ncbi:hypothetical protein Sango_0337000 [Sesamum angolense]|uniref:Disease resistance R13L4/SHOC-2-like LRR domain-containing protein n=1 Tax=Sesamum angolense TaxID=2727404 RepID=A0AAE1X971_9LAMI|nr:hypothetical protein Sango_0337000 [Sesamum angolense]